jgi:Right handed beta helix region
MRFMKSFLALSFVVLAMIGVRVSAQANVNENQTRSIYVDAQIGSDVNMGSSAMPVRSLQAAVNQAIANNQQSIGTKILVGPGVYRESLNILPSSGQTSAPITFQASSTGTAIIAGSDVLSGWNRDSANPSIYTHSWTYNFGNCSIPSGWPTNFAPIALRREMVFVNNVPLTQVMSLSDLTAGTFYVNESNNLIYVWPSSSTNMSTALVETAVRPSILNISGRSNVVLRGVVLRHAATCINQHAANITNSTNVLVDQVQAVWNNWGGLSVEHSSNITVQNSVASHNGGVGFAARADRYSLFEFNESDYNNWRGARAALYDWGMGGTKLMLMHNATVKYHFSYGNQAQGLWFDTDNKNITIDNVTLSQNVLASLQLEANEGPVTMTNSKLCSSGLGVNVINTEKLTLKSNLFYNNSGTNKLQAGIFIAGKSNGRQIRDWETGQAYDLYTAGTVMNSNSFEDAAAGQYVFGTFLTGYDWYQFANTLNASSNHWYDPATTKAFKITNGKLVNLSGWQSATGTDYSSSWTRASSISACAVPTPSFTDFSVNADNRAYTMSSGHTTATLRVNSFGFGQVSLRASGLPKGVSASFSRQTLTSGAVTLTLSAASYAANQNVPITIWAAGSGRVHGVTVYVHVVPV